jgi:hypothetical protein
LAGVGDAMQGPEPDPELLQAIAAEIRDGIEVLKKSKLAREAVAAFKDAGKWIADAATDPEALGNAEVILSGIPPMIVTESETVAGN